MLSSVATYKLQIEWEAEMLFPWCFYMILSVFLKIFGGHELFVAFCCSGNHCQEWLLFQYV